MRSVDEDYISEFRSYNIISHQIIHMKIVVIIEPHLTESGDS